MSDLAALSDLPATHAAPAASDWPAVPCAKRGDRADRRLARTRPSLAAGALHVWRADLERAGGALEELLSPQELRRGAGFAQPARGRRWRRARGILRALLGDYLGEDPRGLRFTEGPHGKPALDPPVPAAPAPDASTAAPVRIHFNLAHSGRLALYAFSARQPVGVDVELPGRPRDELALAARVLGPAVAQRLCELEPAARTREFLRAWTRHEAVVKCHGSGLGAPIEDRAPEPWVASLELGSRAAAAVAAAAPPRELCTWSLPSD